MKGKPVKDACFAVWPTAWGPMGAAAGEGGLLRVILPGYQMKDLVDLLAWEHPAARRDETPFQPLIELARRYFNAAGAVDFKTVACELPAAGSLAGMVYRACREIPYGQTISYSSLATRIGRPDAARAVAAALGRNPLPLVVPCHRVVYADGRAGGFSAPGGQALKQRMLELEAGIRGAQG